MQERSSLFLQCMNQKAKRKKKENKNSEMYWWVDVGYMNQVYLREEYERILDYNL